MLYCWAWTELGLLHNHTASTHATSAVRSDRIVDPPEGVAVRPAVGQRRTATDPRQPASKTHRDSSDRESLAPLVQLYPTIHGAEAPLPATRRKKTSPGTGLCRLGKVCLSSHLQQDVRPLMDPKLLYDNPLVERYASRDMAELWGARRKFGTWRRLWLALAEAQHELAMPTEDGAGPRIRPEQLDEMRAHLDDIDFDRAAAHERRLRHDVMAHIHTFGEVAPGARDILHLGATSCYVTDNTDLILMRDGLGLLRDRLVGVIDALGRFAQRWKGLATLGYTHFQPAQLTTVGKRACLWCYDFLLDLSEIEHRLTTLRFRGAKGTTGTQASFLSLFRGDHDKVRRLDTLVAEKMGFKEVHPVTGQTYSRKVDSQVLDVLSGLGQSAHKFGTDLRLLAHEQEVEEPQEKEQVGSSAMAYKRNPMRAERMCGLARFLVALQVSAAQTAAVQWLERTLDDSVNRRLTLPQAFLTADAVLGLGLNLASTLEVNEAVIRRHVKMVS